MFVKLVNMDESALVTTFEMLTERMTRLEELIESSTERQEREKVYIHEGVIMLRDLPRVPIVKSALDYEGVVIELEFNRDVFEKVWEENSRFRDFAMKIAPEAWLKKQSNDTLEYVRNSSEYFDDFLNYLPAMSYLLSKFCSDLTGDQVIMYANKRIHLDSIYIQVEDIHKVYDALVTTVPLLLKTFNIPLNNVYTIHVYNDIYKVERLAMRCMIDFYEDRESSLEEYLLEFTHGHLYLKRAIDVVKAKRGRIPFKRNILEKFLFDNRLDRLRDWCT